MREIKFKVWGKTDQSWEILDLWDPEKYPQSFWYGESFTSLGYTLEDYDKEEFVVCQYTGLKDKNGVEIYEGDIVTTVAWDYPCTEIVEFIDNAWQPFDSVYSDWYISPEICEIIGNTYDNPELCK